MTLSLGGRGQTFRGEGGLKEGKKGRWGLSSVRSTEVKIFSAILLSLSEFLKQQYL